MTSVYIIAIATVLLLKPEQAVPKLLEEIIGYYLTTIPLHHINIRRINIIAQIIIFCNSFLNKIETTRQQNRERPRTQRYALSRQKRKRRVPPHRR